MSAPAIQHEDDAAFRASVVGASEVAALFDASPFLTRFELWHRKNGTIATPAFNEVKDGIPENERAYFGVKLEPVVIDAACERWGYRRLDTPKRLANGKGLGGHPDQIAMCPIRGRGVLEVKTADWLIAKKWGDEPPLHYLLQSLAYQGLAEAKWGDVIVLVGGNELRRYQYEFRPIVYADLEARIVEFWQSVRAGDAPVPDFTRDGRALTEVIGEPNDEVVDLRHDNDADYAACSFLEAKARAKEAELEMEEAKNRLLLKIGAAGYAMLPNHKIGCNQTKGSARTLITAEHVGTTIGARKGWRRFDVKEHAA